MGLIEIILTILVWRKGWKWYSLIPVGTVFVLALFIGLSHHVTQDIYFLDVFAIIALILMYFNKKKVDDSSETTETKKD